MTQRIDSTTITTFTAIDNPAPGDTAAPNSEIPAQEADRDDISAQAKQFEKRLDNLLTRAAAGMEGLSASYADSIAEELPRPSFGKSGYLLHSKILNAAKKCDTAAQHLAKLSLKDCQTEELGGEQFKIIEEYVSAQNGLYKAVKDYLGKTGKAGPLLQSLMQATQFRASEALNLAGTMQLLARNGISPAADKTQIMQGLSEIDTEKSLLQGMQAVSHKMHGHVLADQVKTQTAGLFAKIDTLEQSQGQINHTEFTQKAGELKTEVQNLKTQVESLQNPQSGLQMDSGLHDALLSCIGRMENRLEAMEQSNPLKTISADAEQLMNKYNLDIFSQIKTKNPRMSVFLKDLQESFASHNNKVEQLKQDIEKAKFTPQQLKTAILNIMSELWEDKSHIAFSAVAMAYIVQRNINKYGMDFDKHAGKIQDRIINHFKHYGVTMNEKEAKEFISFAWDNLDNKAFAVLADYCSELYMFSTEIFHAEKDELGAMYEQATQYGAKLHQNHILEALEHNVDMSTLLEASLRDIPLDQLETIAGDAVLVQSKVLGQGAANTVNLCTYRGKDGEDKTLVFKPELHARFGLNHLTASGLGYKAETKVMQVNIAACRSAESIGCGDVIAKSSIGSFDGKFGLFMEAAKGATFYGMTGSKKAHCGFNSKGETFSYGQTLTLLDRKGLRDTMRANLMRELCRLEWADCLSGQVDRHGDNYLISIDTETGKVTVTGIDNDASFGFRKIGMNRIYMEDEPEKVKELEKSGPVKLTEDGDLDVSTLNSDQITALRPLYGFNQLFAPSHIDKETYDKLIAIDVDEYRQRLAECLDHRAVESAVLRLKDAQKHARQLESEGKVVQDWSEPKLYKEYQEERAQNHYLRRGFFARDFIHD